MCRAHMGWFCLLWCAFLVGTNSVTASQTVLGWPDLKVEFIYGDCVSYHQPGRSRVQTKLQKLFWSAVFIEFSSSCSWGNNEMVGTRCRMIDRCMGRRMGQSRLTTWGMCTCRRRMSIGFCQWEAEAPPMKCKGRRRCWWGWPLPLLAALG